MDAMTNSISPAAARAHGLKNCLTVVSTISRLLESELSERSRARLERSQEAVRRELALIEDDLIAGCSPDAPSREFVLAQDVLRMVVVRVEDQAEAKGVNVCVEAGSGGVMGIAAELAEALANIVLNAVRATPSGGTVLVATRELPDGSQVWVVQDSGPGIPDDIKDRVGTPYFSGSKGGSGLGLALARDIFGMHGRAVEHSLPPWSRHVGLDATSPDGGRLRAPKVQTWNRRRTLSEARPRRSSPPSSRCWDCWQVQRATATSDGSARWR